MNVQMGIKLYDESVLAAAGQLIVDRQGSEMIPADPEEEIALAQYLPYRLPALLPPIGVGVERLELELTQTDLIGVALGACRDSFAAIVGEDLAQFIGQERDAGPAAGTAEKIKWEKDKTALHNQELGPAGFEPATKGL